MDTVELLQFSSLITGIIGLFVAIVFFMYWRFMRRIDEVHYDMQKREAHMDDIRIRTEERMYDLTNQLLASTKQWQEMYHILLSSQTGIDRQIEKLDSVPTLSKFLQDMGLTKEDLDVDRRFVFVLTSFHPSQRRVYETIVNACSPYGFICRRGDEEFVSQEIFPFLLKYMVKASVIIANINGRNPNVFYELGIAHAIDKPVILIAESGSAGARGARELKSQPPFDVRTKKILVYDDLADLEKQLKESLVKLMLRER